MSFNTPHGKLPTPSPLSLTEGRLPELAALVEDIQRTREWFTSQLDAQLACLHKICSTVQNQAEGSEVNLSTATLFEAPRPLDPESPKVPTEETKFVSALVPPLPAAITLPPTLTSALDPQLEQATLHELQNALTRAFSEISARGGLIDGPVSVSVEGKKEAVGARTESEGPKFYGGPRIVDKFGNPMAESHSDEDDISEFDHCPACGETLILQSKDCPGCGRVLADDAVTVAMGPVFKDASKSELGGLQFSSEVKTTSGSESLQNKPGERMAWMGAVLAGGTMFTDGFPLLTHCLLALAGGVSAMVAVQYYLVMNNRSS